MKPSHIYTILEIIALFLALACVWFLVIPYAQLPWDEAAFLLRAFNFFTTIKQGDFNALWQQSIDPWKFAYPPLQELFIAVATQISGFSIAYARFTQALWIIATVFILRSLISRATILPRYKRFQMFLVTVFILSSPLLLFFLGNRNERDHGDSNIRRRNLLLHHI